MSISQNVHGLKEFIEKLHIAECERDIKSLKRFVAEDYKGIGNNGECFNKGILLQRFGDPSLKFVVHAMNEVEYRIYGEVGVATGKVRLKGKFAGTGFEGNYVFTDVCIHQNGQWQVILSQMTAREI